MSSSVSIGEVFHRNKMLVEVMAVTFSLVLVVACIVTYVLLLTSPGLTTSIRQLVESTRSYAAIPPVNSRNLYWFIFLNNIGHFWNPIRIWVWIPLIGAFSLGFELMLNAIVIGAVASFISVTKGAAYTITGLTPHGVIELPAFILEFTGLARWHITTTRAIYTKMSGRKVDRPLLVEGIKDTAVISLISVTLFAIAAAIETFVTPRLLGL